MAFWVRTLCNLVGGENVIFNIMETPDFSMHVPSMGHKVKTEVQVYLCFMKHHVIKAYGQ